MAKSKTSKPKAAKKGMGTYSKKKAEIVNGKPNKTLVTTVREKMLITHAYAEAENAKYEQTGFFFEEISVDEKTDAED